MEGQLGRRAIGMEYQWIRSFLFMHQKRAKVAGARWANVVLMLHWRFDLQSGLHLDTLTMYIACPTPCRVRQVEQISRGTHLLSRKFAHLQSA